MEITTELIKSLRGLTGVSIMQCKKALEEADGDVEKAKIILRKQSSSVASRKSARSLASGVASAYTHVGGSTVGAVVLLCETDFVAKNEEFANLAYNIAMHVAAMNPQYKSREDARDEDIAAAREVFEKEAATLPEASRSTAVLGKVESYIRERALLDQQYIKDPSITVRELINSAVQKFGEKIELERFERLSVK